MEMDVFALLSSSKCTTRLMSCLKFGDFWGVVQLDKDQAKK